MRDLREAARLKPEFATNREGETVADAVNDLLGHVAETWAVPYEVVIATAYFNPAGFGLVADTLGAAPSARLLLGAEPGQGTLAVRHLDPDVPPQRAERARVRGALSGHQHDLERDRDLLGFEVDADRSARRLIEWLRSGRVEVRRFEEGFLHGKAFVVTTGDHGVLAGSSNFTYAGLARNLELNLGQYQPTVVQRVKEWFEELWELAVPFDLGALYEARYEPHSPYLVYLRMLYERYGREVEEEARSDGTGIRLTSFQRDGVWRAQRILDRYNGTLIADGVGLGKSFVAGELIRQAVQDRRQRVLIVAPAALRDGMWRKFLLKHGLGVEVVSFEQLSEDATLNPKGASRALQFGVDDYAMVVIDEAHAYRNPDTDRAAVLRRLLQGSPPKDLVLLSATPVNNSLWDLYYLLGYFVKNDAEFADVGIRSLRDHFARAMAANPDDLTPDQLFDVLDAVAVRRTRHFVKRYYPHDTIEIDGLRVHITFPQPVVHRVDYDLDKVLPDFLPRLAHAIECTDTDCGNSEHPEAWGQPFLTMARYNPSSYLHAVDDDSDGIRVREAQNSGLLRSMLLKRFESSAHAFAATCRRMAASHDAFLEMLGGGVVAVGDALNDWLSTDSDDVDTYLESLDEGQTEDADRYDIESLQLDTVTDRELLLAFADEADAVTASNDPKLAALRDELVEIASQAASEALGADDERDKRKVIVFSYFADTAAWIAGHIDELVAANPDLEAYRGRVAVVSGTGGNRVDALFGFAPTSTEAPGGRDSDRYDILVSTDVLSEGVNLQQARHVINYDLPWNPQKLAQRHGRVDRLGSPHDRVYIRCFFAHQLNLLLGLEERLQRKITQAARSIGVESEILPGSEVSDRVFTQTRDEIEYLRQENPGFFEAGGETGYAYSGEEYRQELRQGLSDPDLARRIRALPWGSGSGLSRPGASPGFVFCARVADHAEPVFRYVDMADPDAPNVVGDTLAALSHAHAGAHSVRVLDDETHRRAYDAWQIARSDIYDVWTEATDPANLQPAVPRVLRDAAQLLRQHSPAGRTQDEIDRLIDAVEAPYGARIQKVIREALRSSMSHAEQAVAVADAIVELGLEPPEPALPLPVIGEDDVYVVCWQAIVSEDQESSQVVGE